jgi:hypothetical protein
MFLASEHFNRILNHGGFFVIFAQPRFKEEYIWGNKSNFGIVGDNEKHDNWSFLNILNEINFVVNHLQGEEITLNGNDHEIYKFLRRNIKGTFFNATFNARYALKDKWITLLKNKFGSPVGGLILSSDFKGGGILILPQIPKTPDVISTLLTEVIADLSPHLFPDLEGVKWIRRDEYELEAIKKFENEKIQVKEEAEKQLNCLMKK